jgi:hypothetical protein
MCNCDVRWKAGQMSIFNAEVQAITEAIKITSRWGVDKRIIMTDSLSNIVAQEKTFTWGNSKKMVLKGLMASREMKRRTRQHKKRWTRRWTIPIKWWSQTGVNGWSGKGLTRGRTNGNPQETPWRRLNQTSVDTVVLWASHGDNKSWYRDYGWGTQTLHKLSDDPKPYCNECEQDRTV